jgi:hypothetical protein
MSAAVIGMSVQQYPNLAWFGLANINLFEITEKQHMSRRGRGASVTYRLSASGCFSGKDA